MRSVAALFVDRGGPYFDMPGVDCWDIERDATTYAGPHPVVSHPPCARWCKLAKQVEWRGLAKVGDDGGTFASALKSVRRWGGVLEHPAQSLAFAAHGIPKPPCHGGWQRSFDGDWVCQVSQAAYGHRAPKLTWLLLSGADPPETRWGRPPTTAACRSCTRTKRGYRRRTGVEMLNEAERLKTPQAFADYLVELARLARPVDE